MNGKLTYKKENGEWGIEGVELTALPPAVYGALCKLKDLEYPSCLTNADRIRAMSDEELSEVLLCPFQTPDLERCEALNNDMGDDACDRCMLDWLRDPVGA